MFKCLKTFKDLDYAFNDLYLIFGVSYIFLIKTLKKLKYSIEKFVVQYVYLYTVPNFVFVYVSCVYDNDIR